jgi:hypothetical protein
MLVGRLAVLVRGFRMSLRILVLALLVMMGRLKMMVSRGLVAGRGVLVMLVRGMLGLSHLITPLW